MRGRAGLVNSISQGLAKEAFLAFLAKNWFQCPFFFLWSGKRRITRQNHHSLPRTSHAFACSSAPININIIPYFSWKPSPTTRSLLPGKSDHPSFSLLPAGFTKTQAGVHLYPILSHFLKTFYLPPCPGTFVLGTVHRLFSVFKSQIALCILKFVVFGVWFQIQFALWATFLCWVEQCMCFLFQTTGTGVRGMRLFSYLLLPRRRRPAHHPTTPISSILLNIV